MASPPPVLSPFTVRAWPVNSAADPIDFSMLTLGDAISRAYEMGWDNGFRQVLVTDPFSTCWAQFNMLWRSREAPANG